MYDESINDFYDKVFKNSPVHGGNLDEIFIETFDDSGLAFGISYIPTRDMGSKSRSDTNSEGDTGTYKAAAELDNVVQIYTDVLLPICFGLAVAKT